MDKFTLPPSPNWQLSNILACNDNGLLAYGSRCEVAIIDVKSGGKFVVSFINLAHKDKINVVVFSPTEGSFKNCLATCGDDGMVRVWDFQEFRLLFCHSGHKEGVRVTGLDWSRADTNRVVSVNDLGSIVCWDLASNTIRRLHCGSKVLPLCLACCPHDKDLIAIGCRGGVILVIDIKGNGKIIYRLRGHEQDVISVSWCPVPYNVIKHKISLDTKAGGDSGVKEAEDKGRDLLLATGGVERSIFIWRTGSDGRYEVVLNLPNANLNNANPRKKGMNNSTLWTSVLWVDPYTLLSTSQFGELLSWDLNRAQSSSDKSHNRKLQPQLLHARHYKGCFSIACPISSKPIYKTDDRVVWTTAMDKHVVGCNVASGSVIQDIPTLGGAVFSMALSPLDPNRLAIGSSDSKVFVWNLSDLRVLHINTYWRKIIGKVMALCWHPREENWLAYGTGDGHVGLIDVGSNRLPTLFRLHHRKQVYRLCWGPPLLPLNSEHRDKLALYSIGDGDIFQYTADITEPNEEPLSLNAAVLNTIDKNLNMQKNLIRSDIVFKPDNSCFSVGNENGSVYILSCKTMTLQHVLYPHKKLMNNLEWHPETVASDNNVSPYTHWLATTCDNIKVYNIPPEGQPELVATLSGHSEKIVGLAWSPHYNGRLLSASYDYSVQIWDVPSQSCLGVCLAHSMAVMCALFSPLDPDIVISGSSDNTVRLWNISQLPSSTAKPEKKKGRVENTLKKQKEVQEATELTVGVSDMSQNDDIPSKHSASANTSLDSSHPPSPPLGNKGTEDYKKRQKSRAVFTLTGPKLTQAKHFDSLYQRWISSCASTTQPSSSSSTDPSNNETPSATDLGYLDFFGDDKAMQRLLMVEESHLSQHKQHQLAQQSVLWRGDVSQMIAQAITKKQLSDWLVSIAPLAGFDVWEEACEAYSAQLVECGDVTKASSYLLAIHKVHEAVRLLADYKQYREAVAIAKCRLPPDDALTAEVYTEWAHASKAQGCLTLAAHCFLAAGNTQACVETLARIKDLKSLKMAAMLASHQGLAELASSLAVECLTMAVVAGNLAVGHQLIAEMPRYQYWSVWLHASEAVSKVKNRSDGEALSWVGGLRGAPVSVWDHLSATCASLGPTYTKLLPHLPTNKTPEFERDVWFIVSGHLAAAWAAELEGRHTQYLRHTVSALSAALHFQTEHPSSLVVLLTLAIIAPNGLFAEGSILKKQYETVEENQLVKSLKAFVCAAVVHWVRNNWSKVSSLQPKTSEASHADGGAKEGEEFKIDWLVELLTPCSAEALDAENVLFFVKKAQKQELQDLITKENIKKNFGKKTEIVIKQHAKRSHSTVENSGEKNTSYKDCSESQSASEIVDGKELKKLDENLNLSSEKKAHSASSNTDTLQNTYLETSKTSVTVKENDTPKNVPISNNGNVEHKKDEEKETHSTSKDNSKVDEKSGIPISEKLNGNIPEEGLNVGVENESSESNKENGEDKSNKLREIKDLEESLLKFEAERVSVPCPFTAYINIKYVIENIIAKKDPKLALQLQEHCDKIWKTSHQ